MGRNPKIGHFSQPFAPYEWIKALIISPLSNQPYWPGWIHCFCPSVDVPDSVGIFCSTARGLFNLLSIDFLLIGLGRDASRF